MRLTDRQEQYPVLELNFHSFNVEMLEMVSHLVTASHAASNELLVLTLKRFYQVSCRCCSSS